MRRNVINPRLLRVARAGLAPGRDRAGWRRGQSAVELALATPLLLLVLIAACDYGAILFDQIELTNAARAGAEYGATSAIYAGNLSGISAIATNSLTGVPGATVTAVNLCCPAGSTAGCVQPATSCPSGQLYVLVNTRATVTPLLAFPGLGLPSSINLSASSQMPVP